MSVAVLLAGVQVVPTVCIVAQPVTRASSAPPSRAATVAFIDSVALAALRDQPLPGLSVAVVKGRDTLVAKGYGFADLENDVAATPRTVYRIGSITKQFTASAILQLAEQGKLSLDDELTKFFPDYPVRGNTVTVRHLLNHTSGIRSYTGLGPKWERVMRLDMAPDSMIALFKDEPFDFATGAQYKYNNSAYFLLGAIIEKVGGQPYGEYVRDKLFKPLDLADTYYCEQRPLIKRRAQGYAPAPAGGFVNADPLSMTQPYAAGSLCSTVLDLVAWTRALHEGKVVSAASLTQMTTPGKLTDGKPLTYGFGLSVGKLGEHRSIAHGGGINGFITYAAHYPEDTLTIVVLTNSGAGDPGRIERKIARRMFGVPEPAPKNLPLPAAESARFAGTYAQGNTRLRALEQGGALVVELPGGQRTKLLYQGAGRFVAADNADMQVSFVPSTARAERMVLTQDGRMVFQGTRAP
ncbi:MAG: serine hydrolase domain-containing protein [Gemmatimonadaceae bacterium]